MDGSIMAPEQDNTYCLDGVPVIFFVLVLFDPLVFFVLILFVPIVFFIFILVFNFSAPCATPSIGAGARQNALVLADLVAVALANANVAGTTARITAGLSLDSASTAAPAGSIGSRR